MATRPLGFGLLDGGMFKNDKGNLDFPLVTGTVSEAVGKVVATVSTHFTGALVSRINDCLEGVLSRGQG